MRNCPLYEKNLTKIMIVCVCKQIKRKLSSFPRQINRKETVFLFVCLLMLIIDHFLYPYFYSSRSSIIRSLIITLYLRIS